MLCLPSATIATDFLPSQLGLCYARTPNSSLSAAYYVGGEQAKWEVFIAGEPIEQVMSPESLPCIRSWPHADSRP